MSRAEAVVERLHALHPKLIDLSLGRLEHCLAALGHPERRLPPVIHVAGTNGKGSTCAFLRAIAEAAGRRAHVYTSPHLVRFHERIRLAGSLVGDAALTAALEETEAANAGAPITVFEITTAAALLLFSRSPADVLMLETGLGGRFDATNVVERPVATAITSISMDHMDFLGGTLAEIAGEKAGILKPGVPCATGLQDPVALDVLDRAAAGCGAPLLAARAGMALRARRARPALQRCRRQPRPAAPGAARSASGRQCRHRRRRPARLGAGLAHRCRHRPRRRCRRMAGAVAAPGRRARRRGLPPGFELWLDGGHNAGPAWPWRATSPAGGIARCISSSA